jgi:hypothetical protein
MHAGRDARRLAALDPQLHAVMTDEAALKVRRHVCMCTCVCVCVFDARACGTCRPQAFSHLQSFKTAAHWYGAGGHSGPAWRPEHSGTAAGAICGNQRKSCFLDRPSGALPATATPCREASPTARVLQGLPNHWTQGASERGGGGDGGGAGGSGAAPGLQAQQPEPLQGPLAQIFGSRPGEADVKAGTTEAVAQATAVARGRAMLLVRGPPSARCPGWPMRVLSGQLTM